MRNFASIRFPLKKLLIDFLLAQLWRIHNWIKICASLNHCTKMKAKRCWLIPPWKHTENLELWMVWLRHFISTTKVCYWQSTDIHLLQADGTHDELRSKLGLAIQLPMEHNEVPQDFACVPPSTYTSGITKWIRLKRQGWKQIWDYKKFTNQKLASKC